jgi:NADH:ubiquinone oxidoreductase subunit 5 (subunit L)/multisubunit Na+/H+ antiporter MnhA subunit
MNPAAPAAVATPIFAKLLTAKEVNVLWLIPLFPAIGAFINGLFGKRIQDRYGKKANHTIAIGAMVLAAVVAIVSFVMMLGSPAHRIHNTAWEMIRIGALRVDFAFEMDALSGMMALVITLIGTGIHIYSAGYMANEESYWRFFAYLNLFVFAMLLLVLGDSFVMMFFGWEGVGLCSYLLIGFWYKDRPKASAGLKAFVTNRVGDFGFVTGVFFLFWALGGTWAANGSFTADKSLPAQNHDGASVVYLTPGPKTEAPGDAEAKEGEETPTLDPYMMSASPPAQSNGVQQVVVGPTVSFRELANEISISTDPHGGVRPYAQKLTNFAVWGIPIIFLICLGLFIGATGKSAQIPLYVWLPDAMAGPTPVSALIHAATMVTAGVYMIARLNFLFALSPGMMTVVAVIGVLTAFFASTIGLVQYDIKKVLAYSTVSQLGFMFIGVGVGAYFAGVFHLLTHAFFKACLFLGSGSVIHAMHFLEHGHGHGDEHADGHGDAHAAAHDDHGAGGHDDHGHDGDHGHDKKPGEVDPESPMGVILEGRKLWAAPNPKDPQDMRNMGGLAAKMPLTRWTYLAACWAIAGFPWAAGFYSKDNILGHALTNQQTLIPGWFIYALGLTAATFTSFYMFRSYYMTFYGRKMTREIEEHAHESPRAMTYVLVVLAAGAVLIGPLLGFQMLFLKKTFFESYLSDITFVSSLTVHFKELGSGEFALMGASFGVASLGWFAARTLYFDMEKTAARLAVLKDKWGWLHRTLFNKYYVDEAYLEVPVGGTLDTAKGLAWVDKNLVDGAVNLAARVGVLCADFSGWIDRTFVDGTVNLIANGILTGGRKLKRVQTGRLNNYTFAVTAGVVVLVVIASFVR